MLEVVDAEPRLVLGLPRLPELAFLDLPVLSLVDGDALASLEDVIAASWKNVLGRKSLDLMLKA